VDYGQLASEFLKRFEITPEPRRGAQVDLENPALNGLKYASPESILTRKSSIADKRNANFLNTETFDCDEMAWELFSQLKTVIRPEEERYSMDVVPRIKVFPKSLDDIMHNLRSILAFGRAQLTQVLPLYRICQLRSYEPRIIMVSPGCH
jgi:hypothetical protein